MTAEGFLKKITRTEWYHTSLTASTMSTEHPPFPEDVPTHPLLVIDYELIKAGNKHEIERLWTAGTTLGFW
jgi:hypothetical protein